MYIPLKPLFSRHNGIGVQFTDEPTGNLDYQTGQEIMKLICASRELYRQTIVMVTHDMDSANYADRIMYMEDGAMKREKRHGIERELSIKRIRSQKKYSILIVSVLLLTCTLIQIGFSDVGRTESRIYRES